ncbi:DUF1345 domain-containing protein [Halpernia sp.]|uniref:DUF1345 domain-containing protein n=1 Tax=Halpernia sp. TaxID=2782209 RepID=UPI003A956C53
MIKYILKSKPLYRAIISFIIAAIVGFSAHFSDIKFLFSITFSWVAFAIVFLILNWVIVFKRNLEGIRRKAREDDGSAIFVFLIILISSVASMFAILLLITSKDDAVRETSYYLPTVISAMILAWATVHTQFLFHYAHEYYDEDENGNKKQAEGLDFPGDEDPDYLDFAYYSFCIGCTFQVSDVETTSKKLRNITLVHSLISFFMNTFVVALTINIIAGLSN